jgi:membrane protein YdbS with pleckstrin-like domain
MPFKLLAGESMVLPTIRKHWIVIARAVFWPTVVGIVLLSTFGILPVIASVLRRGSAILVWPEILAAIVIVVLVLIEMTLGLAIPGGIVGGGFFRWLAALVALLILAGALRALLGGLAVVLISLVAVVIVALAAWWAWLEWQSGTMTITDMRVILEGGVVRRSSKVIPLDRVQDVTTTQTLLGRVMDYGNIEIDTAGAIPNELFLYARQPDTLRDTVFVLSEQLRRGV